MDRRKPQLEGPCQQSTATETQKEYQPTKNGPKLPITTCTQDLVLRSDTQQSVLWYWNMG